MSAPISWIRLERYHLGEVDVTERQRIERSLEDCQTSRERLSQIQQDARPMPALPPVTPRRRWSPAWGGLALAAAAIFAVMIPRGNTTKGGDVSMTLLRERAGAVERGPTTYRDGDRLSVRLTCPTGSPLVSLTVTQAGTVYTPLPDQRLQCGNQVPFPGAFTVTGPGDIRVCLTAGDAEVCESLSQME